MKVDVHAHVYPVNYLDMLDRFGGTEVGTAIARNLHADQTPEDLERRVAMMDRAGVDIQVLSVSPQGPYFSNSEHAVEAARFVNDIYATIVDQGHGRYAAFASLPLPHVDGAISEMERGFDELGMVGVTVTTSILGKPLADSGFNGLFAELDRREAVVFIHPAGLALGSSMVKNANLIWPIGAPFEDTLCLLQLMQARVPQRFPRIKFISSHLGGCLPFLMKRLDVQSPWFMPNSELPSAAAKLFWFDTVNAHSSSLRCACETYGSDRLLLGTDTPYWQDDLYQLAVEYIVQSGISKRDADRIYSENALGLFGKAIAHEKG